MPILYALALAQAVQPSTHHADHPVDHQAAHGDVSTKECTVPTTVIPPFNNSPGAVAQSEAATEIVLATREGREAFPDIDPSAPVCSSFSIDSVTAESAASTEEEIAAGSDLDKAGEAAEEASE